VLLLDADQESEYLQSPTSKFQNVYKHLKTGCYYYLHPDLVDSPPNGNADDTTVILCRSCHEALLKKRKPTYSIGRNNGSRKADLPKGPLILVLGGPGVGKTTVLSRITELCVEYNLPLLCAAMTGIIVIICTFYS